MVYPNTGSTVSEGNTGTGFNKTSTSLSTNILIMVGSSPVGAIQTLHIGEARPVKMIDEVGTDGHIDSAPNQSTKITGTCNRIRFDAMRIAQAFGRGFVHVHSQIYPFDIHVKDKTRKAEGNLITTVIRSIWITSLGVTYNVNDWVITEDMGWEAEGIYSFAGISNSNGAVAGAAQTSINGTKMNVIKAEQYADKGVDGRRGALDVGGLLDLGSSYPALF